MEEYQNVAARLARTRVHLGRATARGDYQAIAKRAREIRRAVVAAAVHHDDLRAQRRERLERGADARRLVQHRHHDAQPRIQAWNRSTLRSMPSGACAFFQAPAAYLFASASVG